MGYVNYNVSFLSSFISLLVLEDLLLVGLQCSYLS